MDAYNRGYGVGINLGDNTVGNATILKDSERVFADADAPEGTPSVAQTAGFYAVAYTMGTGPDVPPELRGRTVISYRGTDNPGHEVTAVDLPISFGGSYEQAQIALARKFFAAIDAAPNTGDLLLTGHSLGGALAGITGALTGTDAVLVDHIGFFTAITNLANGWSKISPYLHFQTFEAVEAKYALDHDIVCPRRRAGQRHRVAGVRRPDHPLH